MDTIIVSSDSSLDYLPFPFTRPGGLRRADTFNVLRGDLSFDEPLFEYLDSVD